MDENLSGIIRKMNIVSKWMECSSSLQSTREVAPQKGGTMTHVEALEHRLELMKVRKYHKQDWNVREIELCEH